MEVRFYHLTHSPLQRALPALLQKALSTGRKIVTCAPDEAGLQALDEGLWTWDAASFIPHASSLKSNDNADQHPVWLTTTPSDRANNADMLVLTGNMDCDDFDGYSLCCDILNGHDEQAVSDGRARWKKYKDMGFDLTYWQQTANGGWEKKA